MISLYLAITYLYKIDQTYLNKINFKLLLEWNHCTANRSQKNKDISFYYLTCICIHEAILHLKNKMILQIHLFPINFCSCINNSNKKNMYLGGKSFPTSPRVKAFLSCPIGLWEVLPQHQPQLTDRGI